ncbi:undecaprenyldiphospho-muramoylpentapeptide beta-N-acetylglucosaminyltransferase [Listeria ilorinensis]|uniref:undecaprenyldiphospho-muramoylpentapeptide beta-N-acetylglucosaminyltransferase n=1 Tax=Listeria ilorinensis TaxID=2867439 RepID=UPI001EF3E410|nr:undecaprenyldiphospho-muramoylpentapeptide beta-N-acetylglucosaminyltransferase [Listeria ilorinensis]
MKVVVSGGGTGGHIYPALAFIRRFKEMYPETEFLYIGTEKGLEADIVPREKIPFRSIEITGFKRKISTENIKTVMRFLKGVKKSKQMLREFQPDVVVGTGGYVCGPVVYAAAKLGIPTLIHEQNSVAGLTNKFLSRYADRVAICFEEVCDSFASEKIVFTGNPRASEVIGVEPEAVLTEYGLKSDLPTVLVFGGSRGARGLNEAVDKALPEWQGKNYQLLYVTGDVHYEKVNNSVAAKASGRHISIQPFVYDMPRVLNAVTLVVSRAGATTLAELTALGVPSILIPSPYVTANHQEQNARSLEKNGAAVVITENRLPEVNLMEEIDRIMASEETLADMKYRAKELGKPDASTKLVETAVEIIR